MDALPIAGFSGTLFEIRGEEVFGPKAMWQGQWPFDAYIDRPIKPAELHAAPSARLILNGWFQRFELIADASEDIRNNWLLLDDGPPVRPATDFAIWLRLGDPTDVQRGADHRDVFTNSYLREDEVRRLAKMVSYRRLFIVTERPQHPMIESLSDLGAEIVSGDSMSDFRFVHSFQKVAISQSTFHWWATFLGSAKEIYFPPCDRGLWGSPNTLGRAGGPVHEGIDLHVNEPRYIYDW